MASDPNFEAPGAPPLPTGSGPPSPPSDRSTRYDHLDALRAFAMLLGIVVHGALSFTFLPIWPAQDIRQQEFLFVFLKDGIHGFRMPLFFLISGFFTTLLWSRRGMRALISHRTKRILLPLVIGVLIYWPIVIVISIWGGGVKVRIAEEKAGGTLNLWEAARDGDLAALRPHLEDKEKLGVRDQLQVSPLDWAAMMGHELAVGALVDAGADVNGTNHEGNTPLHVAAFLGRVRAVQALIDRGAEVMAVNDRGETPWNSAASGEWLIEPLAGALQIKVDMEEIKMGRSAVREMLEMLGGRPEQRSGEEAGSRMSGGDVLIWILYLGAFAPVLHHFWFLYYLVWLVGLFAVVTWLLRRCGSRSVPRWMVSLPWCLLWVVPLSFLGQVFMKQTFGPDTATGIFPWPPKLLYYAVFFFYGAICFGNKSWMETAGRWWVAWFGVSLGLLITGRQLLHLRAGDFETYHALASLCAVAYAWCMSFGFIGFFRRFFSKANARIRYISDASYWLYLAHLPVIMFLQILVSDWEVPAILKFILVCAVTTAFLLWVYERMVRYTFIGAMLNGKKSRESRES